MDKQIFVWIKAVLLDIFFLVQQMLSSAHDYVSQTEASTTSQNNWPRQTSVKPFLLSPPCRRHSNAEDLVAQIRQSATSATGGDLSYYHSNGTAISRH